MNTERVNACIVEQDGDGKLGSTRYDMSIIVFPTTIVIIICCSLFPFLTSLGNQIGAKTKSSKYLRHTKERPQNLTLIYEISSTSFRSIR